MRPQTQRAETFRGADSETVTCPSCHAEMVHGMRFCRACGFRLGEGLAEYVETVRLDGMPPMSPPQPARTTFGAGFAPQTTNLAPSVTQNNLMSRRRRRRGARACGGSGAGWMTWVIIIMLIAGASGAARFIKRSAAEHGINISVPPPAPRSFIGVDHFDNVRGEGVMLDAVLPGTPAEFAGLRDGDLIQRFDGKTINSREDMRDQLRRTPIGKTVEVAYTRDGTARTTMLKTIAPDDYDQQAFLPAGGTGYLGVSSLERVRVPNENYYGVRLGSVKTNQPADIAGLQSNDIVVSFNGDPVRTTTGLGSYVDHAAPGSVVSVGVMRDGQRVEVPVKMGRDN
jgi:membrane-associated protease RseP (regulator of RpoE activity)